ncbi:MAG: TerB family tellurite resistance protein [Thermodesulfobacteriota bacterium]|nr:TerB family tellurite resistance protein [Thermodesulfobacteriota bacterium]
MLDRLKTFFKDKMELSGIVTPAQGEKAIQVATCAVLLEAAMADNELSVEEVDHVHGVLRQLYNLDAASIDELMKMTYKEKAKAIDLWQFTNLINQHYNLEQKLLLMEHIWRVILTDGTLDKFEDYLARKLKLLLRLEHKQWIEAKMRARSFLINSQQAHYIS